MHSPPDPTASGCTGTYSASTTLPSVLAAKCDGSTCTSLQTSVTNMGEFNKKTTRGQSTTLPAVLVHCTILQTSVSNMGVECPDQIIQLRVNYGKFCMKSEKKCSLHLSPPPPLQHLPLIFLPSQITFLSSPSKPRPYNSMGNCRKILHEISKGTTFFLISLETNLPLRLLCNALQSILACVCIFMLLICILFWTQFNFTPQALSAMHPLICV